MLFTYLLLGGSVAFAFALYTNLSVADATGPYGGTTTLSATLTAAVPLSGMTISFTLNGSDVGSAVTNSSGVATLPDVSLDGIDVGTYPTGVGASFAGYYVPPVTYHPSSGTGQLTVEGPSVIEVGVDIKPGSDPNTINLGSNGKVPVAILGSADFDATTVDPYSVTLAGASVLLKGKAQTPMASVEDVNEDGYDDLVVHVDTEALELSEDDTIAILEGETDDDTPIIGEDTIRVVP